MSEPASPAQPDDEVPWHARSATTAARDLGVDPAAGLGSAEAAARLAHHGPNRLVGKAPATAASAASGRRTARAHPTGCRCWHRRRCAPTAAFAMASWSATRRRARCWRWRRKVAWTSRI
ncbi:MAG: cation-transporting P-type ATPase [Accumulibacter sp.]